MTPFERYFADEFPRLLATVRGEPGLFSNGGRLEDASWDRKAAYLLWKQPGAIIEGDDEVLIGGAPAACDEEDEVLI